MDIRVHGRMVHRDRACRHRRGFLVLQQITTPDDVALIRELLGGLFERFSELPPEAEPQHAGLSPRNHKFRSDRSETAPPRL